jgi:hypothetical protein
MVSLGTDFELIEPVRVLVPVVSANRALGVPLAMNFSMRDGPPVSHNVNFVHSWREKTVFAHEGLVDNIIELSESDFGGAYTYIVGTSPHDNVRGTQVRVHASYPPS